MVELQSMVELLSMVKLLFMVELQPVVIIQQCQSSEITIATKAIYLPAALHGPIVAAS